MAKNFLTQLLSLAGIKSPDASGYYDPSVYRDEHSTEEGSSVERYLQKKNAHIAKQTGVAKYLAKKQVETEAVQAKLTGVAKYVGKKQQEDQVKVNVKATKQANMTGVARYQAKLESKNKTAAVKKARTAKSSGVDKYIAKHEETAPVKKQTKTLKKAPRVKVKKEKPVVEKKKKTQTKRTAEKKSPTKAKPANKIINLAGTATQCQAVTLKGTKCRRKSNLETIERTVNAQKYKFAVCSQHNNNDFTPFSGLL